MHFFYKLIAPRPDFHLTMTEKEEKAMTEHMAYWKKLFEQGVVAVYGPVFDPENVYGMAVLETASENDAEMIKQNDPAITSGICSAQLIPMQAGMIRSK